MGFSALKRYEQTKGDNGSFLCGKLFWQNANGMKDIKFTDIDAELHRFAEQDHLAAQKLFETGLYQHSVYCSIQAIEKFLKSSIARKADFTNPDMADVFRNHDIEPMLHIFLDIYTSRLDPIMKNQIEQQLKMTLQMENTRYRQLQNQLRYPTLDQRHRLYYKFQVEQDDARKFIKRTQNLKMFLDGIARL